MTRTRRPRKTRSPLRIVAFSVVLAGLAACEPAPPQGRGSANTPPAAVATPESKPSVSPESTASPAATPAATATPIPPAEPAPKPAAAVPELKAATPPTATTTLADDPTAVRALLTPSRETTLVAQMPGVIKYIPETIGTTIAAGATAVEFDCSELAAKLAMADAEFTSARETHEAKIRLQGLQSAGELEVALAAAAREKARAAIELTKVQMRACRIEAPFGGRVVKLLAKRHQGVNAGTPILEMVAAGEPRMKVNVPSKWLPWLRVGSGFNVLVDETGRNYQARVTAINARVDAVSQSIELEGEVVGNAAGLLPGMSGTARFNPPR